MYKSKQYLYDHVRDGPAESRRPFALTVSLTHPHDPYTIQPKYWDMYEGGQLNGNKQTTEEMRAYSAVLIACA